ncbi:MAG TPA: hypothetical protein VEQ11_15725 [Chloroflexota bacterium]|nr:hypothetical protein [Chloroflexota bacterium]
MTPLLITIDTEPDLPRRRQASAGTLNNIPALLELQRRIPDIKLTLLVTHSVISDPTSLKVLEQLKRDYQCEIGAHLHPEETPPFIRGVPDETSLMRLPLEARAEKLRVLTRAISAHFPRPISYRAGRWKLSPEDLALLAEHGYRADSSVTPYVSWRIEHGPDFAAAPRDPHLVTGALWEVPVSIGLNRAEWLGRSRLLRNYLQLCSLELLGLPGPIKSAWSLVRPIRPVWLRPTYSSAEAMLRLAEQLLARSPGGVLNMMFHSNELAAGGRPFIRTRADADRIMTRVVDTCRYLLDSRRVTSTTLGDYVVQRSALNVER